MVKENKMLASEDYRLVNLYMTQESSQIQFEFQFQTGKNDDAIHYTDDLANISRVHEWGACAGTSNSSRSSDSGSGVSSHRLIVSKLL